MIQATDRFWQATFLYWEESYRKILGPTAQRPQSSCVISAMRGNEDGVSRCANSAEQRRNHGAVQKRPFLGNTGDPITSNLINGIPIFGSDRRRRNTSGCSGSLRLKRPHTEEREPVGMLLARHQPARTFADSLRDSCAESGDGSKNCSRSRYVLPSWQHRVKKLQPLVSFSTSALQRGACAMPTAPGRQGGMEFGAHSARSRFRPCQYAGAVLGLRCSTRAARTTFSVIGGRARSRPACCPMARGPSGAYWCMRRLYSPDSVPRKKESA
jgi:hypothetical protein